MWGVICVSTYGLKELPDEVAATDMSAMMIAILEPEMGVYIIHPV
jgi:hypothetical protein